MRGLLLLFVAVDGDGEDTSGKRDGTGLPIMSKVDPMETMRLLRENNLLLLMVVRAADEDEDDMIPSSASKEDEIEEESSSSSEDSSSPSRTEIGAGAALVVLGSAEKEMVRRTPVSSTSLVAMALRS